MAKRRPKIFRRIHGLDYGGVATYCDRDPSKLNCSMVLGEVTCKQCVRNILDIRKLSGKEKHATYLLPRIGGRR